MTADQLKEKMDTLSELIHEVYHKTNEGPRLLNELFAEYPKVRTLRDKAGNQTGVPTTATI